MIVLNHLETNLVCVWYPFHGAIEAVVQSLYKCALTIQMLCLKLFFASFMRFFPAVLGQKVDLVLQKFHLLFKTVSESLKKYNIR